MILITFIREDKEEVGVLKDGFIVPLNELGYNYLSMNDLILNINEEELKVINKKVNEYKSSLRLEDIKLLAPIPRPLQDVICLGLNYTEHAEEAFKYSDVFTTNKDAAIYFSKRVSYSPGSGEYICSHSDLVERLDYENELAVIIGKDAKDVTEEDAEEYIFGYTILNDISARDIQTKHKQWYFGKSLDGFTPMGPCIVSKDEISYPPELNIRTYVNGEVRQDSNTRMLIHGISEIICELSSGMTLKAGTIIATGTPKGVIMGMDNPSFLKSGDEVICEIEGIGKLKNIID